MISLKLIIISQIPPFLFFPYYIFNLPCVILSFKLGWDEAKVVNRVVLIIPSINPNKYMILWQVLVLPFALETPTPIEFHVFSFSIDVYPVYFSLVVQNFHTKCFYLQATIYLFLEMVVLSTVSLEIWRFCPVGKCDLDAAQRAKSVLPNLNAF